MKTSCFAKYKESDGVSIAIKIPPGFIRLTYSDLFPKWSFLKKYKQDKDEIAYTKEYYKQVLSKLDSQKVWDDLKDSTLLCWEKSDKFCHRHIVAEWLEKELGVEVFEV